MNTRSYLKFRTNRCTTQKWVGFGKPLLLLGVPGGQNRDIHLMFPGPRLQRGYQVPLGATSRLPSLAPLHCARQLRLIAILCNVIVYRSVILISSCHSYSWPLIIIFISFWNTAGYTNWGIQQLHVIACTTYCEINTVVIYIFTSVCTDT